MVASSKPRSPASVAAVRRERLQVEQLADARRLGFGRMPLVRGTAQRGRHRLAAQRLARIHRALENELLIMAAFKQSRCLVTTAAAFGSSCGCQSGQRGRRPAAIAR